MQLTEVQQEMFARSIEQISIHGTGEFRKDLPKALGMVAQTYDEAGGIAPLHGLVIGAAARRLDEIAKDMGGAFPNESIAALASELREFRHREGG